MAIWENTGMLLLSTGTYSSPRAVRHSTRLEPHSCTVLFLQVLSEMQRHYENLNCVNSIHEVTISYKTYK